MARTSPAAHPAAPVHPDSEAIRAPTVVTAQPISPVAGWQAGIRRFRLTLRTGYRILVENLRRMALGIEVPPLPGMFSSNLLAFTAAAVPVLVVGVSSVVYFSRGRLEQFDSYLAQAGAAAIAAQLAEDPQAARTEWIMADQWLDLAESYRESESSSTLRLQVEGALDSIDLIFRLDFAPTVSGGFGSSADIQLLAASATELYAFDAGTDTLWHAWSTGRSYEIDSQFECLAGKASIPGFTDPVSLVVQTEPGALGTEGVVAIDPDGTLLYCAPGAEPLTGQLATPDIGWGKLQAIEVSGNSLYVLDPVKNAVWIYDASGGLFSGTPALYFAEEVPQLGTAVDLALALDELIILYADGKIDRCRRNIENNPEGSLRIRVECEQEPRFQDERPGQPPRTNMPGGLPASIEYSPPPEPSLFFLDLSQGTVYHYSMRLVYQGQYPTPFGSEATAITSGPPNGLFVAVGDQIYSAQLGR
jgi:PAS domain-containing protein